MKTIDFTEFSLNLNSYLKNMEKDNETLIKERGAVKGIVLISEKEYFSLLETLHLLGSRKNAERLYQSIQQLVADK